MVEEFDVFSCVFIPLGSVEGKVVWGVAKKTTPCDGRFPFPL
jgi:hypothetical protein